MLTSFVAFLFGAALLIKGVHVFWNKNFFFALLFVLTGSLLSVGLFCFPQYDIMGFALPGMLVSMLHTKREKHLMDGQE